MGLFLDGGPPKKRVCGFPWGPLEKPKELHFKATLALDQVA